VEFPKRLHVIEDPESVEHAIVAEPEFDELPGRLLSDGAEVAIYRFVRTKKVQVTRRLVSTSTGEPDDDNETPAEGADQAAVQ
jgi:hypothetical protein